MTLSLMKNAGKHQVIASNCSVNTGQHFSLFALFFILTHVICWTLLPCLVRYNLPLDSIEGTIWGHQLEWGYDKNPFLNGWLTALAVYLGGPSGWMIYLFSQLSVAASMLSVWLLAKNILPKPYALIALLLLEGIQYFNFHAIDFNDNTLEIGLWGLTIYFFYQALRSMEKHLASPVPNARQDQTTAADKHIVYRLDCSMRYSAWILTGLFAGLGMMAKYYTAALLTAMLLLLLSSASYRKLLRTLPPYLGLATFLMIVTPHVIWLTFHDFITVKYVFARASNTPSFTNHFFYPAQFAWQQWQVFLPALILFCFLYIGKKPLLATNAFQLSTVDKRFLLYIGVGPFILTLLLSLLLGITLRAGWGMPLLSLWSIILVATIPPRLSNIKIISFFIGILILMGALLTAYAFSLIHSSDPSSANFPGKEIANRLTTEWQQQYHTKLTYVAGSRWIGGNIAFYSPDHPAVFIEWDKQRAPWINLADFNEKGAVFVWSITDNENMPADIRKQFPRLQKTYIYNFDWHRHTGALAPVQIGIAILPPR